MITLSTDAGTTKIEFPVSVESFQVSTGVLPGCSRISFQLHGISYLMHIEPSCFSVREITYLSSLNMEINRYMVVSLPPRSWSHPIRVSVLSLDIIIESNSHLKLLGRKVGR